MRVGVVYVLWGCQWGNPKIILCQRRKKREIRSINKSTGSSHLSPGFLPCFKGCFILLSCLTTQHLRNTFIKIIKIKDKDKQDFKVTSFFFTLDSDFCPQVMFSIIGCHTGERCYRHPKDRVQRSCYIAYNVQGGHPQKKKYSIQNVQQW